MIRPLDYSRQKAISSGMGAIGMHQAGQTEEVG